MSVSTATPIGAEPFRIGSALSRTVKIFLDNILLFVGLAFLYAAPSLLLRFALGLEPTQIQGPKPDGPAFDIHLLWLAFLLIPFHILVTSTLVVTTIQKIQGEAIDVWAALRRALDRFLPILGIWLMIYLFSAVGFLLLIVPGFIVGLMFCVAMQASLAEGLGPWASMQRSRQLTEGEKWRIFGLFLATFLVLGVSSLLIGAIIAFAGGFLDIPVAFVGSTASFIESLIWTPFMAVLLGVLFHDLRAAKEGPGTSRFVHVFE